MKKLVALLLVSMIATVAFAALDEDADSMGIYFDQSGNSNCASGPANGQVMMYMLLMNPSGPTNGFECKVRTAGGPTFFLVTTPNGLDIDSSGDGYVVGSPTPYPMNPAVTLVSWLMLALSTAPTDFFIEKATTPSIPGSQLPALTGGGVLRECGVASGSVALPVATFNGGCPVGEEVNSFGSVKSLFR